MSLRGFIHDPARLKTDLMSSAERLGFDFSVQRDSVFRRTRRLVAFDMDSTLINAEVIDELANRHGVGSQVASITQRAMTGELDFDESFRERSRLLKGLPVKVLHDVAENVALMFSAGVGYLPPATNGANDICFPYCPAIVCHFVSLNVRDV